MGKQAKEINQRKRISYMILSTNFQSCKKYQKTQLPTKIKVVSKLSKWNLTIFQYFIVSKDHKHVVYVNRR